MSKAFFPTFKEQWTKTPNVFFDEVLKHDGVTLNEVRIIGYLIRNTLGYNRDAKWIGVSRNDLIEGAGVSNTRLTETLKKCKEHGWILEFVKGEGTSKKRYIFLNDKRNQAIVKGLECGFFDVEDLEYLNEAGINRLLDKHGLLPPDDENERSTTETGEENDCSSTESGEEQTFFYRNGISTSTETGEADDASTQTGQAVQRPLKTSFKDNVVVVGKEYIEQCKRLICDRFEVEYDLLDEYELSDQELDELAKLAAQHGKDLLDCIYNTFEYAADNDVEIESLYGAFKHAIVNGWRKRVKAKAKRPKKLTAGQPQEYRGLRLDPKKVEEFRPYNWVDKQ